MKEILMKIKDELKQCSSPSLTQSKDNVMFQAYLMSNSLKPHNSELSEKLNQAEEQLSNPHLIKQLSKKSEAEEEDLLQSISKENWPQLSLDSLKPDKTKKEAFNRFGFKQRL